MTKLKIVFYVPWKVLQFYFKNYTKVTKICPENQNKSNVKAD